MNKQILGLTLAAAFTAGTANAALIDDFDGGAQSVPADGTDTVAYAPAFGGERTVEIAKAAGSTGGPLTATAAVIIPPGIYSHSADALTTAISMVTWNDANGVDLVEGLTNNVFEFDILSIDQGQVDLSLMVTDLIGGTDTLTLTGAGVGTATAAFASFTGVDFTQVTQIKLIVDGGEASDLTLDSLGTTGARPTPEPTAIALLGMGLAAFGFGRRKAK